MHGRALITRKHAARSSQNFTYSRGLLVPHNTMIQEVSIGGMRRRVCECCFVAGFKLHENFQDAGRVKLLANTHVCERGGQSAAGLAGDEFTGEVVVDDELAVGGICGGDGCDLQHCVRLLAAANRWGDSTS